MHKTKFKTSISTISFNYKKITNPYSKKPLYFLNKNLDKNKNLLYSLLENTYGLSTSQYLKIFSVYGLGKSTLNTQVNPRMIESIGEILKKQYLYSFRLKKYINDQIKNHIVNNTYKGIRHVNKLPVNGQNTKRNRKTQKRLAYTRFSYI